jgi:hypothetical protein
MDPSPLSGLSFTSKGERGRKESPPVDFQLAGGGLMGDRVIVSESVLDELS